jgi:hypothetical protein
VVSDSVKRHHFLAKHNIKLFFWEKQPKKISWWESTVCIYRLQKTFPLLGSFSGKCAAHCSERLSGTEGCQCQPLHPISPYFMTFPSGTQHPSGQQGTGQNRGSGAEEDRTPCGAEKGDAAQTNACLVFP